MFSSCFAAVAFVLQKCTSVLDVALAPTPLSSFSFRHPSRSHPQSLCQDGHLSVLPPPSLSCLPPASSVLSPRRCTLRSGPTRSHAAPPITICEAQHPRHASIWKPCPTARSLGHQAKHEHTVLTQCQVGAHCVSESAVPAAPPSLLSGGCYCCCGDRLGTRRWLYLRCLLVVVLGSRLLLLAVW